MNKLLLLSRGEFEAFYNLAEQEKKALRIEFMELSNMVFISVIYILYLTLVKVQQLQGEKESLSLDLINSQAMCSDLQQKLNEEMAAKQPMIAKVTLHALFLFSFSFLEPPTNTK